MAVIAEPISKPVSRFHFFLDRREVLEMFLVAPAIIYVLLLVGLPLLLAVYYSLSAYTVYDPTWKLVGLVFGKFGAFLLLRPFPGRKIARALIVLPFVIPVALATIAWRWLFDSLYSVFNWCLIASGILDRADVPNWLGTPWLAMLCVIIINAWRFFPFAIVLFLAGITAVPQDVIDAAT